MIVLMSELCGGVFVHMSQLQPSTQFCVCLREGRKIKTVLSIHHTHNAKYVYDDYNNNIVVLVKHRTMIYMGLLMVIQLHKHLNLIKI